MTKLHTYSPFIQLLILLGLYIVFTFSFYGIATGYVLPHIYGISAAELQNGDFSNPHLLQVMKIFQFAYSIFSFLLPALIFFLLWHKKPFKYAGLSGKIHWGWAFAGVILLFISLPFVGLLSDLNQKIPFGKDILAMQERAKDITRAMLNMPNAGDLFFNLILIALIPAIAEEFFFRGAIQRILISATKRAWMGIAITAILFSLVHGEMLGFFPRALLGAILGLVYYYSGNLWYAIFIHFINNGFQVVLVFLHQHHYISMDITQDTPTPVIIGIISLALAVGLFIVYKKLVNQNPAKILWEKEEMKTKKNHS